MVVRPVAKQDFSGLNELSAVLGRRWTHIHAAAEKTTQVLEVLRKAIGSAPGPVSDTSVVLNGSLARYECTKGSDLDWTLLVDAQANADHQENLLSIRRALNPQVAEGARRAFQDLGLKEPGSEGTFGNLAFSQPMIHYIGGENDSNSNTTRRVLLLLEALPLGNRREAFDRVRLNVLRRYLIEDKGLFHRSVEHEVRWIPLFLLNDFARYWRTMAVDFAYKQFSRGQKGYAIRSIKLGTSRKLLYASGLLACFWCDPKVSCRTDQEPNMQSLTDSLEVFLSKTPLERFALYFVSHLRDGGSQAVETNARNLFDSYDGFLALLNDEEKRNHLENLSPQDESTSAIFLEARKIRHSFRLAIEETFTGQDSLLREHTLSKGIF
jgi:hypothetical protein